MIHRISKLNRRFPNKKAGNNMIGHNTLINDLVVKIIIPASPVEINKMIMRLKLRVEKFEKYF